MSILPTSRLKRTAYLFHERGSAAKTYVEAGTALEVPHRTMLRGIQLQSGQRLVFFDTCWATLYSIDVIESFKHRGLKRFVEQDDSRRLPRDMVERIKYILTQLNAAKHIEDMDLRSFYLYEQKGSRKGTWSVTVRANRRITFRFKEGHALGVDFEDYH